MVPYGALWKQGSLGVQLDRKIKDKQRGDRENAQNCLKNVLKIPPDIPLYSFKGNPRSQDPWVSNWAPKGAL